MAYIIIIITIILFKLKWNNINQNFFASLYISNILEQAEPSVKTSIV